MIRLKLRKIFVLSIALWLVQQIGAQASDPIVVNDCWVSIPLEGRALKITAEDRAKASTFRFYASRDKGRSWELVEEVIPGSLHVFTMYTPKNGDYWFLVQAMHKDAPDIVTNSWPVVKVVVKQEK